VYFATFAALVAIGRHNGNGASPIRTVGFPAFGTGFGSVSFDEAARQMAVAYRHYLEPPTFLNWDVVIARQKDVAYDGDKLVVRR